MKTIALVCDTCNKEFNKARNEHNRNLRLGKTKFYCSLSCGGKRPDNIKHIIDKRSDHPVWMCQRNQEDEYSIFRPSLRNAKNRSKTTSNRPVKEFDLTVEHLKEIWDNQNGICPITGFSLELRTYRARKDNSLHIKSASLDRIDNSKGYIIGNVRFVSVMFNFARNKFSDEEVIEFAKAVVANRG